MEIRFLFLALTNGLLTTELDKWWTKTLPCLKVEPLSKALNLPQKDEQRGSGSSSVDIPTKNIITAATTSINSVISGVEVHGGYSLCFTMFHFS